jgi:hypothetical protein
MNSAHKEKIEKQIEWSVVDIVKMSYSTKFDKNYKCLSKTIK